MRLGRPTDPRKRVFQPRQKDRCHPRRAPDPLFHELARRIPYQVSHRQISKPRRSKGRRQESPPQQLRSRHRWAAPNPPASAPAHPPEGEPVRPVPASGAFDVTARSPRRSLCLLSQLGENAGPRPNASVEARELVFLVGRMYPVVDESKANHQRIETEDALEFSNDRDRTTAVDERGITRPFIGKRLARPCQIRVIMLDTQGRTGTVRDELDRAVGRQAAPERNPGTSSRPSAGPGRRPDRNDTFAEALDGMTVLNPGPL